MCFHPYFHPHKEFLPWRCFACCRVRTWFWSSTKLPECRIIGDQTAIVTGPEGEEIYPDRYGRVKGQFFWDREGKWDEKTSCWIRVSQGWAGTQYGTMAIPRIGHEVIVSYPLRGAVLPLLLQDVSGSAS